MIKNNIMLRAVCLLLLCIPFKLVAQEWQLVWNDEFNTEGALDKAIWNFEEGFARNEELQWYQPDNL